jgi:hypothetical protein
MDTGEMLTESIAYTRDTFEGKWVRWLIFVILSLPMALFPFVFDMTKIMDRTTGAFHWELVQWDQVAMVVVLSVLLSFFLSGYMVRIYRGTKPAPDFDDWGNLFFDGLKMCIVSLIWFLPVMILLACVMGLTFAGIASGNTGSMGLYLGLMLAAMLVMMILAIVVSLFSVMGIIRFARTGSIREGLRFSRISELIGRIGWGQYIVALIILFVVMLIFGIVIMVVSLIPYIGWVIRLIITPPVSVLSARYYTLLYDKAGPQPEPAIN